MNVSEECPNHRFAAAVIKNSEFLRNTLITSISFHVVLSIAETLGNGLIIVTILKSKNLQTPSYLLITSLAFTDLLVGLVYHPSLAVVQTLYLYKKGKVVCRCFIIWDTILTLNIYFAVVSFVTNAIISIDRYLALSLKHRYRIVVTKKLVRIVIMGAWLGSGVVFKNTAFYHVLRSYSKI